MIKNLKQAKKLVEKYEEIISNEDRELEEIDVDGGWYNNYGEYLYVKTNFNSYSCKLCTTVRGDDGKNECDECIWSLSKNGRKDFKRKIIPSAFNYPERYCLNKNYEQVENAVYLLTFKEALSKRVKKLKELIRKAEKDELQSK